jgi:zinc transporter
MSRSFLYRDGKATELPFAQGAKAFGEAELVWLHFDGREDSARDWIAAQLDIPEIARDALVAQETRPRSDIIGHGAVINLRGLGLTPEDDPDALVSVRFWAETGRVISVTFRSPAALEPVMDEFLCGTIMDPGDLLSAFADNITDALDPDVAEMGDSLDECELGMDDNAIHAVRRKVGRSRTRAISYRRFLVPQRQALERLASATVDWFDEHDRMHLREAADRAARMAEELEAIRERAALMHEELTDRRAEQMDARALLISIVALIFLPLTFITGLLGMNVDGIPYQHEPWAFWGVVGVCVLLGLMVVGWFIRAHWVKGDGSIE